MRKRACSTMAFSAIAKRRTSARADAPSLSPHARQPPCLVPRRGIAEGGRRGPSLMLRDPHPATLAKHRAGSHTLGKVRLAFPMRWLSKVAKRAHRTLRLAPHGRGRFTTHVVRSWRGARATVHCSKSSTPGRLCSRPTNVHVHAPPGRPRGVHGLLVSTHVSTSTYHFAAGAPASAALLHGCSLLGRRAEFVLEALAGGVDAPLGRYPRLLARATVGQVDEE